MRLLRRRCKSDLIQLFILVIFLNLLRSKMEMRDVNDGTYLSEDDEISIDNVGALEVPNPNDKMEMGVVGDDQDAVNKVQRKQDSIPKYKESRDPSCRGLRLVRRIDPITIVVPFCNEPLEVLLGVLRSIKDNTWKKMIYEIVFIKGNCKGSLPLMDIEAALTREYDEVVVARAGSEKGIMEGRRKAPIYTAADQIVFVDVNCRFTPDWLRPLLEILAMSNNTIVSPMIETINPRTGKHEVPYNGSITGFDWHLRPRAIPLPQVYRSKLPTPFLSPAIPSPVFAIKKTFYIALGTHDSAISTWGPAQLELSLKTWLCNGNVLVVPCSRVRMPRSSLDFVSDYKNLLGYRRVAQVWMSVPQRQYVFRRRKDLLSIDAGNLQGLMKLKENLKCKPFDNYLSDIAMDVTKIFPLEEPRPFAAGQIMSLIRKNICVTSTGREGGHLLLATCNEKPGQLWSLDWKKRLKNNEELLCWTEDAKSKDAPFLEECSTAETVPKDQIWTYEPDSGHIQNRQSMRCLAVKENSDLLREEECEDGKENQKWKFSVINHDLISQE
ncbi:polypeptide N-acetylgalactosaminyltransferase-like 6 [Palaemon carinicauda]|uniref:polypeptide N-acetylgalactosaminyltransferase-like 6 n=1 Tax=Palaemon carinicauda TaxID=392227 RepID=UPI0035B5D1BB